ncbi:ATP-binding protein [Mitsuaria sp. 7]|uniref:ATP-binding protein n=1 Tax=Mitsuaria sp. 7 TaxID=1658665 RepID=UPI00082D6C82|nr:ATP-binding protein [Mitsuaria sp. 7]
MHASPAGSAGLPPEPPGPQLGPPADETIPTPIAAPRRRHFLDGGGEMGGRMRALDWTATPLGPSDGWPASLKTVVRMMLDSRYAMWMAWGSEMTFFCNDAYLPTLGLKREWALGAPSQRVWAEVWDAAYSRIRHVQTTGEATWDEGLLLFLERSGFPEETYHTFSYSPVYDDDLRVDGMWCVVTEVTDRVIGERRLRVLRDLAARTVGADETHECARRVCGVVSDSALDLPFSALYLTEAGGQSARRICFSLPPGSEAAAAAQADGGPVPFPEALSLIDPPDGWPLPDLAASGAARDLPDMPALGVSLTLPPWPETLTRAVLLPLRSAGKDLAGFLVLGVSPRLPLDEDYRDFLNLVAGQVSAALADASAYEAERRRAESLAELDRAKTAFFSNISHEFRTPLTLMLGPLEELVTAPQLDGPMRDRLALVLRNAARLQRLVNTLLDFSRIEAGRSQARYQATDLAALTRDLASTFRSAMERVSLGFEVDCAPLSAYAYVDREMWEKIVLNLLSNAFKFTMRGQVTVRLRERQEGGRGQAVLEVADTGAGIPADELPKVFERFHRVAGAEGRTHEGSGIGLALVQELVRLHGGRIEASSVHGEGTLFRVLLPLGREHLPQERVEPMEERTGRIGAPPVPPALPATTTGARAYVEEALRWLPAPEPLRDVAPGRVGAVGVAADRAESGAWPTVDQRFAATFGARIIVADDNADMRAYLRDLLSPFYAVELAADGLQALEAARREPPDLLLSDVMMPRLDGLALLTAIRVDARLGGVPVVLLSARAGEEARIEGLDSGADDYMIKPFSSRELLARLGALLELRRLRQSAEAAFRRRTEQFETLLNEAPMGVFLVEHDGATLRLREANPTARATFGDPPDLIGERFDALLERQWGHPLSDQIVSLFQRTLETGDPYHTPEFIQERSDLGITEAYEWQISRIPLPDGSPGVVCYYREISAPLKARRRLEAADRQKDQFLAMLAHELRNPIAPIRSAGDVLARLGLPDERSRKMVAIIRRQVDTLTRLVDDLLDVSRITQGRVELQLGPLLLSEVVAQAVETAEPLMRERRHQFSVTSSSQPLRVHGDLARLVQCVANVLTNAAKYTDPGGRIDLAMSEERAPDGGPGVALIRVSDDGIGVPHALQVTMFDLFVQGDRALDRSQGGLGIGLSLVRQLIERHGGSVSVHSEGTGCGARFELRVPLIATAPPLTPLTSGRVA